MPPFVALSMPKAVKTNISEMLDIHVQRGRDLVNKDFIGLSDPYVVVKMGTQKRQTRVVDNEINPEWNDNLTFPMPEPRLPIELFVWDRDTFNRDDPMGDAIIDIKTFLEAKGESKGRSNGTIVKKIQPSPENCLDKVSLIEGKDGKVVQKMCLKLRNVKSGKVELELRGPKYE